MMGISLATPEEHFYIPTGHNSSIPGCDNLHVPVDFFDGISCVFHNAKFDIRMLERSGIKAPSDFYDVMLMAHLVDENYKSYELDMLSLFQLGARKDNKLFDQMKKWGWDDTPPEFMSRYAEQDAYLTLKLYYHYLGEFSELYPHVWETDKKFLQLLIGVEDRGLLVDREIAQEYALLTEKRIAEIQADLGFDPAKTNKLHARLFGTPPWGLGLDPLTKTPTGRPQVDKAFLEATNHPICGLLLEFRKLQKQLTSYYRPYVNLSRDDGRIHCSFKQHGTVTGRMSCEDPNLQQIPRQEIEQSPIKKLFKADPGKQLWEFDYKAMELRMAAIYAKEQALLDGFENELDVHRQTADAIKITRQQAKTLNFSMIYGGGVRTLVAQLKIKEREAGKILKDYRALYPRIYRTALNAQETAEQLGYVRVWTGRRRHIKFQGDARLAFNSIIQGGCGEVLKHSALRLDEAGFDIRNLVHDSVWVMLDSEKDVPEVERIMQEWTKEAFRLQLTVESKRLN